MSRWQPWLAGVAYAGILVTAAARVQAADAPVAAAVAAPQANATLDLTYIPASAVGALVVRPQPVFTGPNADWLPLEVLSAAGMKETGIDPVKIKEAVAVITAKKGPEPEFGVILRFTEPYSKSALLATLSPDTTEAKLDGKSVLLERHGIPPSFYLADEKTLVVAPAAMLKQMIAARKVDSPLTKLLAATDFSSTATAVLSVDAVHDLLKAVLQKALNEVPLDLSPVFIPDMTGYLDLPDKLSGVFFRVDLKGGDLTVDLTLQAHDAASAVEVEKTVLLCLDLAKQMIEMKMSDGNRHSGDPVQTALEHYLHRITNLSFDKLKPTRHGTDVSIKVQAAGGAPVVAAMMGLLLPAVQAARSSARRVSSMNNLRQIGLALFSRENAKGAFPAHAIFDKQGKPLLSWRVAILPYIDQQGFYDRFHLDEPWDSAHNKPLIAMMPQVYNNPNREKHDGTTTYLAPVGKGLAFESDKELRPQDFTDGLSNTILIVEANESEAVPWTKPADLEVDLKQPLRGLGAAQDHGLFHVLFADGSVHTISKSVDVDVLKALFTRNGGEVVNLPPSQ